MNNNVFLYDPKNNFSEIDGFLQGRKIILLRELPEQISVAEKSVYIFVLGEMFEKTEILTILKQYFKIPKIILLKTELTETLFKEITVDNFTYVLPFPCCAMLLKNFIEKIEYVNKLEEKNELQSAEISDFEKKFKSYNYFTLMDPLTGLYNNKYLNKYLVAELKRCERYNHPLTFFVVRINNLEFINETYGFTYGDRILQEIGYLFMNRIGIVNPMLRFSDIAGRLGGNKLAVILTDTQLNDALIVAERICNKLSEISIELEETSEIIRPHINIGISSFSGKQMTFNKILNLALEALKKIEENSTLKIAISGQTG